MLLVVCLTNTTLYAQENEMSDLELFQFKGKVKKISYYKAAYVLGKLVKEYLTQEETYTPKGFLISRRFYDIDGNVIMNDSCVFDKEDKIKVYSGQTLSQTYKYDSNHNVLEMVRYGNNGEEIQKFVYEIENNKRKTWKWYTMGNLFRTYTYIRNKKGEILETRYDNVVITSQYENGNVVSCVGTDGYTYSAEYDKQNNKIKEDMSGIVTTYKYQDGALVEKVMTRPNTEITKLYYRGQSVMRTVQKNSKEGNPIERQVFYSDGPGTPEKLHEAQIFEYEYY